MGLVEVIGLIGWIVALYLFVAAHGLRAFVLPGKFVIAYEWNRIFLFFLLYRLSFSLEELLSKRSIFL